MARDKDGVSTGFGYVHFLNDDAAHLALETLQGRRIEGKCISLNPVEELSAQFVVIFKNLEKVATETGLRELLSRSDNVTTLRIQKDEKGCSLGYGFATFSNPSEAEAALQHNGKTIVRRCFTS